MADFKKQGGSLTGREERYDGFEGEPRAVGGALGGHSSSTTSGPHSSNLENKMDPRVDSDRDGSRNLGAANTTGGYGSGATGPHSSNLENRVDPRVDSDRNLGTAGTTSGYGSGPTGTGTDHHTGKKPGLMDKLNPKVRVIGVNENVTITAALTYHLG